MFMAKDGTNRGGARLGSGQKKKPIADKLLDGNPGHRKLTVMEFTDTADLTGEPMPEPRDYLKARQKDGSTTLAADIFHNTGCGSMNAVALNSLPRRSSSNTRRVWRDGFNANRQSTSSVSWQSILPQVTQSRRRMSRCRRIL